MAQQPFISAMPHHLTALAFFLQAAAAWPWDPTVKVPGLGVVEGYTTADVTTFNRVPYAQPPLGSLRFRAPVSVRPWSGTFDAKGSVPLCPQIKLSKSVPIAHLGQEDCLYLSIVVPPKAHTEPAPVLFWIYGGAYILGDVSEFGWYDATTLAKTTGAIVVSVNYRVGPFGFLAHQVRGLECYDGLGWDEIRWDGMRRGGAGSSSSVRGQALLHMLWQKAVVCL